MVKAKKSTLILVNFILAIGIIFCICTDLSADEGGPVEIGSNCSDIDAMYHLTSDIQKTFWDFNELYAVPVGTISPESWEQSSSFSSQYNAALQGQEGAAAYTEACGNVWQNFFSENADVIVSLKRTISTTDQILQCVSGTWVLSSTQYLDQEDVSDWLTVNGSPFDVMSESSLPQLQAYLEALLENLNSQPGAASDP